MAITYDPLKRQVTLNDRGLDFEDAAEVFGQPNYTMTDDRQDYGETRYLTIGHLRGRMVVMVWTPRGGDRHVISMRKANDREQTRFKGFL